jgi:hypothetical protein
MALEYGILMLSLDFELYWGVRDKIPLDHYRRHLHGVKQAVPAMLRVFQEYGIHATWAVLGFLHFHGIEELKKNLPHPLPRYRREELSPFKYMDETPDLDPACHFAPDLIATIKGREGQEIATHTFSHYYCLEEGQSLEHFEADLEAAVAAAAKRGIPTRSLVFPRNQWKADYLPSLAAKGVICYRGNEGSWIYRASDDEDQNIALRAFRLADAYLNLSGHHTWYPAGRLKEKPFNFPSSRFLRPYSPRLAFLDGLRARRIAKAMEHAAVNRQVFHLWWHPHNFGLHTAENIRFLADIFEYFKLLRAQYGMRSLNMGELAGLAGGADGR